MHSILAKIQFVVLCSQLQKVYAKDFTFYDQIGIRREPTTYIIDEAFDPADAGVIYKLYTATTEQVRKSLPFPQELGYVNFEPDYTIVLVVFGDDTNDEDMFAPGFYKVAMGNGHPDLKAMADEVAPDNIDDGIYRVCEKNGWFEPVK